MICPKCEYEYMDGVKVCPDCGTKLVTQKDFEGHLVHHSDWIIVYTCSDNNEADMYKSNLEGAGVETMIVSQKDRNFPAVGNFAVIKILVKKTDAASAIEIINDINKRDDNSEDEGINDPS